VSLPVNGGYPEYGITNRKIQFVAYPIVLQLLNRNLISTANSNYQINECEGQSKQNKKSTNRTDSEQNGEKIE
jgi:hypothetical protein